MGRKRQAKVSAMSWVDFAEQMMLFKTLLLCPPERDVLNFVGVVFVCFCSGINVNILSVQVVCVELSSVQGGKRR